MSTILIYLGVFVECNHPSADFKHNLTVIQFIYYNTTNVFDLISIVGQNLQHILILYIKIN